MYPSNISDKEWEILQLYFEPKKPGRPRKHDAKIMVNAVRYIMRTGCQWRQLPKDFPPWKTVYSWNLRLKNNQEWKKIHDTLVKNVRKAIGKNDTPTIGIIDSQSVKTAQKGGLEDMMQARR